MQKDLQTLGDDQDNLDYTIPVVMYELVKAALKGVTKDCSEVRVQLRGLPTIGLMSVAEATHNLLSNTSMVYRVRLPNSSLYALDLGDTGRTPEHAVLPWAEFMEEHVVSIIDSMKLGDMRRSFGNLVRREMLKVGQGGHVGIKEKVLLMIDRHRAHMTTAFEIASKSVGGLDTIGQTLTAPAEDYLPAKTAFMQCFEMALMELKQKANETGNFEMHIAAIRIKYS